MQELQYKLVDDGTFCVSAYTGDESVVEIPASVDGVPVTILADGLFQGHAELTELRLPDGITDFGEFLFDGCVNLRHLKLPARLSRLWGYSFVRCGLEELVLPEGLRSIPPFCFKDCKALKKLVCGAGLQKVHAWAFAGCDQLTEFLHGSQVEVDPQAFSTKELNAR